MRYGAQSRMKITMMRDIGAIDYDMRRAILVKPLVDKIKPDFGIAVLPQHIALDVDHELVMGRRIEFRRL